MYGTDCFEDIDKSLLGLVIRNLHRLIITTISLDTPTLVNIFNAIKLSRVLKSLKITSSHLSYVTGLVECIRNVPEIEFTNCQITTFQFNNLVYNLKNSRITKLTMVGVFRYGFGGFNETIKYKEKLIEACNKQGINISLGDVTKEAKFTGITDSQIYFSCEHCSTECSVEEPQNPINCVKCKKKQMPKKIIMLRLFWKIMKM